MITLLLISYLTQSVHATPQKKLSSEELSWYQNKFVGNPPENAQEEVNSVKIFSDEARKLKLDKKKVTELEVDYILSQAFLDSKYKELGWDINQVPSESDLKKYYERFPLIKVNHLVVSSKEKADKVDAEIKAKKPFKDLVQTYSEDESSKMLGGLIEDLGKHNFYISFYTPLIKVSENETVGPIEVDNNFHFFQLVSKTPFTEGTGPYLAFLRQEFQNNQKKDWEKKLIAEIRKRRSSRR